MGKVHPVSHYSCKETGVSSSEPHERQKPGRGAPLPHTLLPFSSPAISKYTIKNPGKSNTNRIDMPGVADYAEKAASDIAVRWANGFYIDKKRSALTAERFH